MTIRDRRSIGRSLIVAAAGLALAGSALAQRNQVVAVPPLSPAANGVQRFTPVVRIPLKDEEGVVRAFLVYREGVEGKTEIDFTDAQHKRLNQIVEPPEAPPPSAAVNPLEGFEMGPVELPGCKCDGVNDIKVLQQEIDVLTTHLNALTDRLNAAGKRK
jgi:hypothetical protein